MSKALRKKVVAAVVPAGFTEVVITNVQILRLHAERFIAPDVAKKGIFNIAIKSEEAIFPEPGEEPVGKIVYSIQLTAYSGISKIPKTNPLESRSFVVEITLEGSFDVLGDLFTDDDQMNKANDELMNQMHIRGITQMIPLVADLGYGFLRPRLGLRRSSMESDDTTTDKDQ